MIFGITSLIIISYITKLINIAIFCNGEIYAVYIYGIALSLAMLGTRNDGRILSPVC